MNPKRNDPCPCGSGLKYKKCCLEGKNSGDESAAGLSHTLSEAYKEMSQRNWREAIHLFKSLESSDADLTLIYQAIAACYEGLEEFLSAAEFYEKALKAAGEAKKPELYYQLGVAAGCGLRIDRAETAFNEFVRLSKDTELNRHATGILRILNQIQEGNADPNVFFVQVQIQRAFAEMEDDDYDLAAARLERVLQIDPENAAVLYNLGVAYTFLSQEDEAIDYFTKCVNIQPAYFKAWYNLGQISLLKKKDLSRALNCFDRVISINPNYVGGYHQRGVVLELLGDKKAALESWKKTLELDGANAAAREAIKRLSA